MEHNKKHTLPLILSMVLTILLITIGLSFAYFSANITGTENTTTIQASGGVMNIHYDGGENINTPNIFPSNDPFATKHFTLTGKSTTNDNMNYHIILVIEENTFTENALTYKLISTNTDNNGTVAPSTEQIGIVHGPHELFLGDGMFVSPSNNDLHSYTLKLYFPDTEKDQNDDMNKTFKAYVNIREGHYIYPGYNPEKGVNHPVLFTGMTPIKWDSEFNEIETTEDDSDWYDYDEKRWANAKSADGSYWVWIPRYAYKIESCYHMSGEVCEALTGKQAGEIDVKFLKGTSKISSDNFIVETSGYIAHDKDTSMHHFLHPAFKFNIDELGFWVAKFEPTAHEGLDSGITEESCSGDNVSTKSPLIIPNVTSWRCINVSNAYKVSLAMKDNLVYGWQPNEIDSHLMTNYEWGAVTFLSNSEYGAAEEVWNNSYNGYLTGCSGSNVDAVSEDVCVPFDTENGQKASTTHNIYGVYDMSGGAWDYLMSNYNNLIQASGFNDNDLSLIHSKYITRYVTSENNILNGIGMDYDLNVYGDAVYETSQDAFRHDGLYGKGNERASWYNDWSYLPRVNVPWFARGGHFSHPKSSGLFAFSSGSGEEDATFTFRPVLVPLS